MLYPEKVKILAKKNQPKPEEARYWIDLTADPYGGIWKVWNGLTWIRVFASSGSGGGIEEAPSDGNLYGRKNQVWQEIDIPDVSIYATKTELDQKADKDSVPDLSDYLTAGDIAKYYQPKGDYLTEIPEGYLTITEADGRYALKGEDGGEADIDLSDYLTIANAESTYATKSEVQTVREYAQTIELNKQDTLQNGVNIKSIDGQSIVGSGAIKVWKEAPTDAKLYGRQSAQWVEIQLPTDYVTEDDLSEWTQKIDAKQDILVSGTNIKTINGTSLLGSGNITLETPEGGLSDAASDGKLYGRKDGTWSEIVIPDISGLATKSELSSKLDTETYNADKATFALKTEIPDTSTFITTETADGKYQPKGTYLTKVPDEYVTEVELTEQLALKADASELSNYLTTASATSTYATKTDLDSKLDTSTYTSDKSTFATTAQLSSKQDTLVSGTNIKTVNGQTILGEGNVQIETPEGGIADAPSDDNTYARKNGAWTTITIPDTSNLATKTELSSYATKAELPSNVSQLTNDAGYITNSSLASYATQEYVTTQISNLVDSAPEALNTLDELAAALNDDSNFATTVTNQIAAKLDITTYTSDKETFALKTELSSKADSSALANYLTTATAESTYAKKSEIPQQSLLPHDFFGVIDNYSTGSYITINADSKYLSVYNVQSEIDLLDIRLTDGLYKGVEYLIVIISNNYTLDVRPLGYNNQEIQIIGDTDKFSMQANQILEISAIRTDSAVICRVSSSSDYTGNIFDGTFG